MYAQECEDESYEGYNYAAGPATAPTAVPMTHFPRQPTPAGLSAGPTTSAFLPNTNPVLTPAVPGQAPPQFPPRFSPAQTLLAAGPPFTRAMRPPFHKPVLPGNKGLKRKLDDMRDRTNKLAGPGGQHSGQNLYCKVCCVTLNAPLQAKQHFEGKNHAKKLKMFTDEKSSSSSSSDEKKNEDSGDKKEQQDAAANTAAAAAAAAVSTVAVSSTDSLPKSSSPSPTATQTASTTITPVTPVTVTTATGATSTTVSTKPHDAANSQIKSDKMKDSIKKPLTSKQSPSTKAELNPEIYCKICGVSFNSPKQAQQHYQGKNHTKRVRAVNNAASGTTKSVDHMPPGITKQGSKFNCVMCDLQMTSQAQLDNHLKGTRHLAQVQMAKRATNKTLKGPWGDIKYAEATTSRLIDGIKTSLENLKSDKRALILEGVESFSNSLSEPCPIPPPARKHKRDFSMYRTPSGKYYCSRCNVTLNSEAQFEQHFESKKHKLNNTLRFNEVDA